MTNHNRDSADNWPTQEHPPQFPQQRRPGRATRWGIGLAAAAVLVGGGAAILVGNSGPARLSLAGQSGSASHGGTSGSSGSPGQGSGTSTAGSPGAAVPDSQAGVLNTVLSSADSPTTAELAAASPTQSPATAAGAAVRAHPCAAARRLARTHPLRARLRARRHPVAAHRLRAVCRRRLGRVRLLLRGIHGQFTFQTRHGVKTLAFERGTIQSVASGTVTVRAADGTTWTWHLVSNTVIREGGKKTTAASLADGQRVFAGGPVVNGADDARLIVIRPAAASAPSASPSS